MAKVISAAFRKDIIRHAIDWLPQNPPRIAKARTLYRAPFCKWSVTLQTAANEAPMARERARCEAQQSTDMIQM